MLHGVAAARGLRAACSGLPLVQVLNTQEMQLSLRLYSHLTGNQNQRTSEVNTVDVLTLLIPPRRSPRAQAQLSGLLCTDLPLGPRLHPVLIITELSGQGLCSLKRLWRDLQGLELSAGGQAGSCQRRCSVRIICSLNDQLLEGRGQCVVFSAIYLREGLARGKHPLEM